MEENGCCPMCELEDANAELLEENNDLKNSLIATQELLIDFLLEENVALMELLAGAEEDDE